MNNLRRAQAAYDAQTPDDPDAYRDSQHYLDWIEMVTEQIIGGDEGYGIDPVETIAADEPQVYVYENICDKHYVTFCEDQMDYD